jgi:hypothetical protein
MPTRRELYEAIGREREAAELEANRARRRDLVRAGALCVVWMLVGVYLLGWSVHTTDERYGWLAFYGGLIVGNGGMVFTLLAAYRRGEERGDW